MALSRRGPRTVPYIITKNSVVDGFSHGYGKGKWILDEATAQLFDDKGYGRRAQPSDYTPEELKELEERLSGGPATIGRPADAPPSELKRNLGTGESDKTKEPMAKRQPKALPEDFPGREELIEGGYDTMDKVRAASEEDLSAVKGVGKATLTKIGLALGSVED